ncbi:hypothetical protein SAMN05421847_0096 [Halpernia humi]|uniref:Uncharacterized protein n=1 Tax=Halpernia humi TaxID=493375 RepID=A0A1H5SBU6_9FLAO|nr:hypothetical protein SAMN05421847_0096 [Halpernia humi]
MKKVLVFWYFYYPILIPSIIFSIIIAGLTGFNLQNFSRSFFLLVPLFHFIIYEILYKNEYHFYNNFGFSRVNLWVLTCTPPTLLFYFS